MDPATLAAAAAAFVAPYLTKAADKAVEKLGESLPEAAGKVIGWLRGKLSDGGRETMDALAVAPDDAHEQESLKRQIEKALKADPALAEELKELLPDSVVAPLVSQAQTVSGAGAKAAQVAGNNNQTAIG